MGSSHSKAENSSDVEASNVNESTTVETIKKLNFTRRRDHPDSECEVLHLRQCLLRLVPVELVNLIIEFAEYWPRLKGCSHTFTLPPAGQIGHGSHRIYSLIEWPDYEKHERSKEAEGEKGEEGENEGKERKELKVMTEEKPKAVRVVRKVVFRICWRHDQGWNAELESIGPTHEGSCPTGFEVALFQGLPFWKVDYPLSNGVFDPPTVPPRVLAASKIWQLQSNLCAPPYATIHEIVWTDEDNESQHNVSWKKTGTGAGTGFVRSIRPGDKIVVVARARSPDQLRRFSWPRASRRSLDQITKIEFKCCKTHIGMCRDFSREPRT